MKKDELTKSNEWFFQVFNNNAIAMVLSDMESTCFLYVNAAFLMNFGYTETEAIGKTVLELNLVTEASREKILVQLNQEGFVKDAEILVRKKNGETFWSLTSIQIMTIEGKKYALTSFFNINERIKISDNLAQLAAIVAFSDDAIISKSLHGMIKSWNKGAEKMFGYTEQEALGQDIALIVPPDYLSEEKHILESLCNGQIIAHFETIRMKKNGEKVQVSLTVSPIKNAEGRIIGISKIARDITFRKETEKELAHTRKELAFEYKEKEKMADELIIANSEFAFQHDEKEKRAAELIIANKELDFQNQEKEKRAAELFIANKELDFQNQEKEKRAAELAIADIELNFQIKEKEKRAAELAIADIELDFQTKEKGRREIANKELEAFSYSLKLASQYSLSLIEASRDPLFTISPQGKITDMNEATVRVTGLSREKLIGTDFFDYFTEPQKAREGYQQVFLKGFVSDYPLTIKDHKLTDVLFNGAVYKDDNGDVIGAVVVARDITDQKRIETELIEARVFAELATGIAEEAKGKAEKATRIAEDAVKAKQQFLSNMSHEIRTPMNAIIGFTKVVLKTDLSAKQKEYLTAIKISGDALIVLINDILDLAKVDAGKMTFEKTPFKMAASISAMLHLFETKIQEKNLTLITKYDPNIPEVLVGDPVRLHQIILNLVSNAVKFTAKGSITVSINMINEDEEAVTIEFSIADTGIGITESKMEKIFENFQQASSGTARLFGGTGLGLAIVKQLVEPQGGKISLVSKIDEGSTFSFTLSFQKTKEDAELTTELEELDVEIKNIQVLVVEDIALNQLLMKTLLDDFGFGCDIAGNGKIAIEKLATKSYDIILMDLQMPEMNGFEATEYIRNTLNLNIPIVALTADVTTVDLAKCKSVGMNDYIAKPVDEKLLYNKIVYFVKKPVINAVKIIEDIAIKQLRYTHLAYLMQRTKNNAAIMGQMISAYLEQTPPLIQDMKQGLQDKNWDLLYAAVHKMIPSFAIMGISTDFESIAKKVQEYARTQQSLGEIEALVLQLEHICTQACKELTIEFEQINHNS